MKVDVAIVGAGLAGLSAAVALGQAGLSVAVIDKQTPNATYDESIDLRVFAITPASITFLTSLGVWQRMPRERLSPYREMQVWDAIGNGSIHFDCRSVHRDHLGFIIENKILLAVLLQRCDELGIHFLTHETLQTMTVDVDYISVTTKEGHCIEAALLIGADGASSWVREKSGCGLSERSYDHHAIVAKIAVEQSHQFTAWQCFLPEGPLALLPLVDPHYCSIVWSTTPSHAAKLMQNNPDDFSQAMTDVYRDKLGTLTLQSERIIFPLIERHALSYSADRVVLVGDAAHTIHPLAGQGANLGFYDVATLTTFIHQAFHTQQDIASVKVLRRYERARRGHNQLMLLMMSAFQKGFMSTDSMVTWLRNKGMSWVSGKKLIKNQFIKAAMGEL